MLKKILLPVDTHSKDKITSEYYKSLHEFGCCNWVYLTKKRRQFGRTGTSVKIW